MWRCLTQFGDVHVTLLLHKKKDGGVGGGKGGGKEALCINPGDYKAIARTQVPLWDVNIRPRPNTVAAGACDAATVEPPAAAPVAQRILAG